MKNFNENGLQRPKTEKMGKMVTFWAFGAKNDPIFTVFGAKTAFGEEICNFLLQKQLELKISPFTAKNSKNREKGLLEASEGQKS